MTTTPFSKIRVNVFALTFIAYIFSFLVFLTSPSFIHNYSFACIHVIPEINSINPNPASPNSPVTIQGQGFQAGGLQVVYEDSVGIELLTADLINEYQISFNAPSRATVGKSTMYVHTCGGSSSPSSFTIENKIDTDPYCKYDCGRIIITPTPIKQIGCVDKKICDAGYPYILRQPTDSYEYTRWNVYIPVNRYFFFR